MSWLQHNTVQLNHHGIACSFYTSGQPVKGWIMPDGMGVFQGNGTIVEFHPETIVTDHTEGLQLARQGAGDRHFERHDLGFTLVERGRWVPAGDNWLKECNADLAGVQGVLSIHVTFKSGSAELLRFYTEFQTDKHAQAHGSNSVRQGCVGGSLAEGEVVRTSSGRITSPFPKITTDTERKASNTFKRVDHWLIQNALDEATARGDEFNALQFKAALGKPQQADKESAEEYLFGQQPVVLPSPLRLLAPTTINV